MATLVLQDQPLVNNFSSVYTPIKYTVYIQNGDSDGLTGTVKDFVSLKIGITPFNETTDQWLNGTSTTNAGAPPLPDETFVIRVPYVPYVHSHHIGATINDPDSVRLFTFDLAPVLRSHMSYNLRPCHHETNLGDRDITQSQIAYNLFTKYQVGITPEYINTDGIITMANGQGSSPDLNTFPNVRVINAALSYNEEHTGYFSRNIRDEDTTFTHDAAFSEFAFLYTHNSDDVEKHYARQKYLSVKPTTRVIGIDECEYLTFAAKDSTDSVYAVVTFYGFDGQQIPNGDTGNYALNINTTANGDGTLVSGSDIFSYGNSTTNSNPVATYAVLQIGVGTRNIKENAISNPNSFFAQQPLSDFSNVAYYTVSTHKATTPFEQIGETITYYIDHKRKNHESTRFHWQSRLGGIDSYTFDGTATRGIETSSTTYQQTIYPKFQGVQSLSGTSQTSVGMHTQHATYQDAIGAFTPRIAGYSDDQYPSIRKHKVDAFGNGSATSKPLCTEERQMIEDMLSSPNAWVERGYQAKEIFREDFSSYSSLDEITNNWTIFTGNLNTTTGDELVTDEGHITGDKALQIGDNSGNDVVRIHSKKIFEYNPNKLYEFEIRLKGVSGTNNPFFYGYNGLAADGVTFINNGGANLASSQHYHGAHSEQLGADNKYRVFRGYVSGHIRNGGSINSASGNIMNHSRAYTGVEKFSILLLINYASEGHDGIGQAVVDYMKLTEYTADDATQTKIWSEYNKSYYVPVLLKDGAQQIYNSEELTSVTVNYVESRKKRTIIT
tara:strand:- start:4036 stop:6375 length:2340 start_codon:yes stop_codon:yes gene_type:complete